MVWAQCKKLNSKVALWAVLFIVILIQLGRIIYSFQYLKEDYHSDEIWSFGLANSFYEPYIFQDADETHFTNYGEWISTDVLKNYLTVDSSQRFSYSSVFYNQSKDLHPPFYFIVLHTICSFFPRKFSCWFGFAINIIVFPILQIYLFKLTELISKSKYLAVLTCVFFGFSSGAINMFIFIRMYAMLAMFTTMTTYYHAQIYITDKFKPNIFIVFFITLFGCLTHHFFPVYAGALSACFCFYYLFTKKIKKMFVYALTMICSVFMSILIFPATIDHLFGRRGDIVKYTFDWQITMTSNLLFGELTGIRFKSGKTVVPLIVVMVIFFLTLIGLLLSFLFRNELWFKKIHQKIKSCFSFANLKNKIVHINWFPFFIFTSSLVVVFTVSSTVSLVQMSTHTDRYLFYIFPSFCALIICIINALLSILSIKHYRLQKIIASLIVTTFILSSNYFFPCIYYFQYRSVVPDKYKNADVVFVPTEGKMWNLTNLSEKIINSNNFYMDTLDKVKNNMSDIYMSASSQTVYMLVDDYYLDDGDDEYNENDNFTDLDNLKVHAIKNKVDERMQRIDFEKYMMDQSIFERFEYIGKEQLNAYMFSVYKLR